MLQAKVLRSPHPHARIKRLDVSRAWDVPGVVDILTCLDPEVASLKPHQLRLDRRRGYGDLSTNVFSSPSGP